MSSRPLVSVGVPVYNGEATIRTVISSLLAQTYAHIEIVISDNCSNDHTREICLEYAAVDPRVSYSRTESNVGMANNVRRVLQLAKGELFTWTCADDVRPIDAVEVLVRALNEAPKAVMAHGPVIATTGSEKRELSNAMVLVASNPARRGAVFTRHLQHNSMLYGLYKTAVARKVVFTGRYGMDYLFCLQVSFLGPVAYTVSPMIVYHERGKITADPMGDAVEFTFRNIANAGPRMWKCWTVLTEGCRYLWKLKEESLFRRTAGSLAYCVAFASRYAHRLMQDSILILCSTLAAIPLVIFRRLRRVVLSMPVDR